MLTKVTFYEFNDKMIVSMQNLFDYILGFLPEKYEGISYDKNNRELSVKNGSEIKRVMFCFEKIENEYDAVRKSIIKKVNDISCNYLSVINLGSRSYNAIRSLQNTPYSRKEEARIDSRISEYLTTISIDTLFIPYVTNEIYSRPELIINRAQYCDKLDNYCDAQEVNRHSSYVYNNMDIDKNAFIQFLLQHESLNVQMIGEILFKALYNDDWKKSVKEINSYSRVSS